MVPEMKTRVIKYTHTYVILVSDARVGICVDARRSFYICLVSETCRIRSYTTKTKQKSCIFFLFYFFKLATAKV